ncbi:hypothetical protein MSAN_01184600 [Mycena sanguinolenta]|uniref:Uncharacterized protein n=1 Tax=Mycena sanguinolenta TaxID=230812 RepID=A0A8H7D4U8_9AGAR|nr:hypothetical protein MSAN_01184600 [Mycena sanguinolenta]
MSVNEARARIVAVSSEIHFQKRSFKELLRKLNRDKSFAQRQLNELVDPVARQLSLLEQTATRAVSATEIFPNHPWASMDHTMDQPLLVPSLHSGPPSGTTAIVSHPGGRFYLSVQFFRDLDWLGKSARGERMPPKGCPRHITDPEDDASVAGRALSPRTWCLLLVPLSPRRSGRSRSACFFPSQLTATLVSPPSLSQSHPSPGTPAPRNSLTPRLCAAQSMAASCLGRPFFGCHRAAAVAEVIR